MHVLYVQYYFLYENACNVGSESAEIKIFFNKYISY
jgi:hypothetical protein